MSTSMYLVAIPALLLVQDLESKIVNGDFGKSVSTASGKDGRLVIYPAEWLTAEGKDGRKIAYPFGWLTAEGKGGRKVAHPVSDGRRNRAQMVELSQFQTHTRTPLAA